MLAYVLAFVVGLGSFSLYMAAFFFPEVHRKNDFIWSGVGLFYALVLWICAGRITGGLLLGQTASVALLGWLGWQTLMLRRQTTPLDQQTALPSSEELKASLSNLANPETLARLSGQVGGQLGKLKDRAQTVLPSAQSKRPPATKAADEPYVPLTPADFASARRGEATTQPTEDNPQAAIPVQVVESADESSDRAEAASDLPTAPAKSPTVTPTALSAADLPTKLSSAAKGLVEQVQSTLKKVTAKRESKPVYVRKQFRTPAETEAEIPEIVEADGLEPSASTGHPKPDEVAATNAVLQENEAAVTSQSSLGEAPLEDSVEPADAIVQSEIEYEAHPPAPESSSDTPDAESLDAQSTLEGTALEAIPPHPPSAELVEEAIADAEKKHLPASPPNGNGTDSEPVS